MISFVVLFLNESQLPDLRNIAENLPSENSQTGKFANGKYVWSNNKRKIEQKSASARISTIFITKFVQILGRLQFSRISSNLKANTNYVLVPLRLSFSM